MKDDSYITMQLTFRDVDSASAYAKTLGSIMADAQNNGCAAYIGCCRYLLDGQLRYRENTVTVTGRTSSEFCETDLVSLSTNIDRSLIRLDVVETIPESRVHAVMVYDVSSDDLTIRTLPEDHWPIADTDWRAFTDSSGGLDSAIRAQLDAALDKYCDICLIKGSDLADVRKLPDEET